MRFTVERSIIERDLPPGAGGPEAVKMYVEKVIQPQAMRSLIKLKQNIDIDYLQMKKNFIAKIP